MSRVTVAALIAATIVIAAPAVADAKLPMFEARHWAKHLLSKEKKQLRQDAWIVVGSRLNYCERWTTRRVFCRGWVEAARDGDGDWRCGYDLHVIEKRNGGLVMGRERDRKCRHIGR